MPLDMSTIRMIVNKILKDKIMNKILIVGILIVGSINVSAQSNLAIAEAYFDKLELKTKLPYFTNRYIDELANERPDVTSEAWDYVKASIDYTPYKNKAIEVLMSKLSTQEMQSAINEYDTYIPVQNLDLRTKLLYELDQLQGQLENQINVGLESYELQETAD